MAGTGPSKVFVVSQAEIVKFTMSESMRSEMMQGKTSRAAFDRSVYES